MMCLHGHLISALDLPTGERYIYAIFLLHRILFGPLKERVGILVVRVLWYDINCKFGAHMRRWAQALHLAGKLSADELDAFISILTPLPPFHSNAHRQACPTAPPGALPPPDRSLDTAPCPTPLAVPSNLPVLKLSRLSFLCSGSCQAANAGLFAKGAGRLYAELLETLWSNIGKLGWFTQYMTHRHRHGILEHGLAKHTESTDAGMVGLLCRMTARALEQQQAGRAGIAGTLESLRLCGVSIEQVG